MGLKAALIASAACLVSGQAGATCAEAFPPNMKERPAFTCVSLTDRLLVRLEGATRTDVIKAMKANGRPFPGEENVVQFVSAADHDGGYINFEIVDDRVVRIFGEMDTGRFLWNPSAPDAGGICSDLPGSHYAPCK